MLYTIHSEFQLNWAEGGGGMYISDSPEPS